LAGFASGAEYGDMYRKILLTSNPHLQVEDRQSTSAQSQFLNACRSRNRGVVGVAQCVGHHENW
jgi:hypothetical protein